MSLRDLDACHETDEQRQERLDREEREKDHVLERLNEYDYTRIASNIPASSAHALPSDVIIEYLKWLQSENCELRKQVEALTEERDYLRRCKSDMDRVLGQVKWRG